ncbi:hypothetical protein [Streptomyces lunaelactis]|uniref:hypothetical protein n=1 Tax=Streptomyces lunaelactis TaxID=1535768 RepID=UPI0015859BB4|nr:hypothetical protein [Streptomyces lunaelactis]NUK14028.1 hypothetical protein [Streptomyces lunaelactis]
MPKPLPRRPPGETLQDAADVSADDWQPFGVPSPGLVSRSERARFLLRKVDQEPEVEK